MASQTGMQQKVEEAPQPEPLRRTGRRRNQGASEQGAGPPPAQVADRLLLSVPPRLKRNELPTDTATLARFLIGKTLAHEVDGMLLGGRIVETEAYVIGDAACHGFIGETRRTRSLFGERGHAYVYLSYGCWPCLNVVGERPGIGSGVLLRAIEPLFGVDRMRKKRPDIRPYDITKGPGRLAGALEITLADDGRDLCRDGPLWLGAAALPVGEIGVTTRIGLTKEADRLLRFFERGNPYVSGPKYLLR